MFERADRGQLSTQKLLVHQDLEENLGLYLFEIILIEQKVRQKGSFVGLLKLYSIVLVS